MKNIVICSDGTNNKLAGDLTNVARMYQIVEQNERQAAFYDPGVGTMASPDQKTWFGKRWSLIKGLAFGAGLDQNVFDAYQYLMKSYEPGDKVFLFGFSRGAFTIRVLAGLLHALGLLNKGNDEVLPQLWKHYRAIRILPNDASTKEKEEAEKHSQTTQELRQKYTRPCEIAFLGPWDTVGSVGMYNMNQSFPFTFENPSVRVVRHAVSLDERRAAFRSNVSKADPTPTGPKQRPRVMNVWFPGVHSDIGGGYSWVDSGLAMIAFAWMVREAKEFGLLVNEAKYAALVNECAPSATAKIHESLDGAWVAMEYLPARRYDWKLKKTIWRHQPFKSRTMLESPILHRSVKQRFEAMPDYRPPALPPDALNGGMPIED
jgi:uncharacterized protein (DUF2235 family)